MKIWNIAVLLLIVTVIIASAGIVACDDQDRDQIKDPDQIRDIQKDGIKDQTKDQLKDGSCQDQETVSNL